MQDLMYAKNITKEEMAKHLGMGLTSFYRRLSGEVDLSLPEAISIAKKLDSTLDEIFLSEKLPK